LPGVGAFGASMEKIRETIPMQSLKKAIFEIKKPFLGICVGMQVLADLGYEFEENSGLGWVNGVVQKLDCANLPLPHVGWNSIHKIKESALFERIEDGSDFYFVHSYAMKPVDTTCITSVTDYGGDFCSSLQKDNLYGVQFHPEKSHVAGKRLIENFINLK
jgi:glutamine amidotransferase